MRREVGDVVPPDHHDARLTEMVSRAYSARLPGRVGGVEEVDDSRSGDAVGEPGGHRYIRNEKSSSEGVGHEFSGPVRGVTSEDVFEVVDAAYGLVGSGDGSAVRRVQLARSEGRLVLQVSGGLGDGSTRRRVEAALGASRALDLSKYVAELEALLGVDP
jgi:hypothetical protein